MASPQVVSLKDKSKDEWLALRKLGASDAPAALSISPYKTPFQLWSEKCGLVEPFSGNEKTLWGERLEGVVASVFSDETGLSLKKSDNLYVHGLLPYLTATPDYETADGALVEIKTTSERHADEWEYGPSDSAHVQLMHQLAVTGRSYGFIVALIGGQRLVHYKVERDEDIIVTILDQLKVFWDFVERKTPPLLRSEDLDTLRKIYPSVNRECIELNEKAEPLVRDYLLWREKESSARKLKETAQARLQLMLQDAGRGTVANWVVSWEEQTRKAYTVSETKFRTFKIQEIRDNGKE